MRATFFHTPGLPFPFLRSSAVVALCLAFTAFGEEVREIVVTESLKLEKDAVLSARLVVRASGVVIDGDGATLQGPGVEGDPASHENAGTGVFLDGVENVTVRNLKARGFAIGLRAKESRGLLIENSDFSRNYDNPKHGWGELPPRGGLLLERVSDSVVRHCRANRVWDALHLIQSDGNLIEKNDFSHTSNTCAKLWRSSRNRFLENNLSYGIRLDRAAGEVHARDSTGVLIESGSDDNYWFRNDVTHGGDGIFIRVLNGWVSRGNVFVENDTSYANNNCVESWSPGNVFIRNKANHGSYGFWLGGSDQTVLIGNEACYNGLPDGNHQAPEPGFGHGGIVFVNGPASHIVVGGNRCSHNNGGGVVLRGDHVSKERKWRAHHWIIQQNILENNRWAVWGRHADEVWIANNRVKDNAEPDFLEDVGGLRRAEDFGVARAPRAVLRGPDRAVAGRPVEFDARESRDPAGRTLRFRWTAGDAVNLTGDAERAGVLRHVFETPGFYRLGLTVDNGALADLAWRDLIVTAPEVQETGTERQAARWRAEEPGTSNRPRVEDDFSDFVSGGASLKLTVDPYSGGPVTAMFECQEMDVSGKKTLRFWFKTRNENLTGFQHAGPVATLRTPEGTVTLTPEGGRNFLQSTPRSESRWTWTPLEIPLAGGDGWTREDGGTVDLRKVTAIGFTVDSWGGDPFMIWLDGLSFE